MEELRNAIEKEVYEAIKEVEDPELYISILELGLIYDIKVEDSIANIKMTFTSMACPAGPQLKEEVYLACLRTEGVKEAKVEIVWNPPWDPKVMASEDAKMALGIY